MPQCEADIIASAIFQLIARELVLFRADLKEQGNGTARRQIAIEHKAKSSGG